MIIDTEVVAERKVQLEQAVRILVREFEKITGIRVEALHVDHVRTPAVSGYPAEAVNVSASFDLYEVFKENSQWRAR